MNVMQRLLDEQQRSNARFARVREEQDRIWEQMVKAVRKRYANDDQDNGLDGTGNDGSKEHGKCP